MKCTLLYSVRILVVIQRSYTLVPYRKVPSTYHNEAKKGPMRYFCSLYSGSIPFNPCKIGPRIFPCSFYAVKEMGCIPSKEKWYWVAQSAPWCEVASTVHHPKHEYSLALVSASISRTVQIDQSTWHHDGSERDCWKSASELDCQKKEPRTYCNPGSDENASGNMQSTVAPLTLCVLLLIIRILLREVRHDSIRTIFIARRPGAAHHTPGGFHWRGT